MNVMKFHSAANGLATGTFQKCNWGQIDPMVDRGLNIRVLSTNCDKGSCVITIRCVATIPLCRKKWNNFITIQSIVWRGILPQQRFRH